MKKYLLVVIFGIITVKAQHISKNHFWGIQAGILGANIYNEYTLSKEFVLRAEMGLMISIRGGDFFSNSVVVLAPEINLSPKWYYNLKERKIKGKNIDYNSGDFIALDAGFIPDWFLISNYRDYIYINSMIYLIPTWGLRRNFAKNFNYEFKFGIGIRHYTDSYNVFNNKTAAIPNISFRIGCDF